MLNTAIAEELRGPGRIRQELRHRGWSQRRFAAKTSTGEAEMSRILNGYLRPYAKTRARIARVLGLPEDVLFPE